MNVCFYFYFPHAVMISVVNGLHLSEELDYVTEWNSGPPNSNGRPLSWGHRVRNPFQLSSVGECARTL
jgi:hypothetical protein